MTGQEAIAEAVRQMIDGEDYTPLERLIEDLSPDEAVRKPAGSPYSIATIAWHTWFWNNVWIVRIKQDAGAGEGFTDDGKWPDIAAEDWPDTRDRLLESLRRTCELAASAEPAAKTWREQTVGGNLLQIAIHSAYHIGQIALLRQELGLWPPRGGE